MNPRRMAPALLLAAAALCGVVSQPRAAADPLSPPPQRAGWIPSPGPWEILQREDLRQAGESGEDWRVIAERRPIGSLLGGRAEIRVYLPRLRVMRLQGDDSLDVAIAIPTGNRDLAVLSPEDPEISAVPSQETEDRWGRWPNLCSLTILDAQTRIDLDGDGSAEIAFRRVCSCRSSECSGIAFLSLDPRGVRLLDPSGLVEGIDLGPVRVRDMHTSNDPARPILEIEPELLTGCRFLARLGIRGEADCEDCCLFPVLIRPAGSAYEVYFDRPRQLDALRRAEKDLGWVAAGPPDEPLRSVELAMVARAASFYHLTGTGEKASRTIRETLGSRAQDWELQSMLRRIDDLFMAPTAESR